MDEDEEEEDEEGTAKEELRVADGPVELLLAADDEVGAANDGRDCLVEDEKSAGPDSPSKSEDCGVKTNFDGVLAKY